MAVNRGPWQKIYMTMLNSAYQGSALRPNMTLFPNILPKHANKVT